MAPVSWRQDAESGASLARFMKFLFGSQGEDRFLAYLECGMNMLARRASRLFSGWAVLVRRGVGVRDLAVGRHAFGTFWVAFTTCFQPSTLRGAVDLKRYHATPKQFLVRAPLMLVTQLMSYIAHIYIFTI